jgi:hypothetical protein
MRGVQTQNGMFRQHLLIAKLSRLFSNAKLGVLDMALCKAVQHTD